MALSFFFSHDLVCTRFRRVIGHVEVQDAQEEAAPGKSDVGEDGKQCLQELQLLKKHGYVAGRGTLHYPRSADRALPPSLPP